MSDRMEIRESDTGMVRVFQLDLPAQAVERFTIQAGTGEWPLKYALGATHLSAPFVDVVDLRDLGGMSLSAYLAEAYAIPKANLRDAVGQLDGLKGHVVILPSQAFERKAQTLAVQTPMRWVGTFQDQRGRTITPPLRARSAQGRLGSGQGAGQAAPTPNWMRWLMLGVGALAVLGVAALVLS